MPVQPAVGNGSGPGSQEKRQSLDFVQRQGNLRQVFLRDPADGLYPKMKSIDEMQAEDVPDLVNTSQADERIQELVTKRAFARDSPQLVNALI